MIPKTIPQNTFRLSRKMPGIFHLWMSLTPVLLVVGLLFGGGLLLGFFQGMAYIPSTGLSGLTLAHFKNILLDPDFAQSLWITLYISLVSTLLAALMSLAAALLFTSFAAENRLTRFIFQIPLTVPHLVIAIAVLFMVSPAGMFSRVLQNVGIIESVSEFPLLVNDRWGFGIMLTYIWKEVPFITMMILSVLLNAGKDLMDVGKTLKANRWQRFRHIILPMIFPSLAAACLIVFAYTFGAFEVPYLLGQTHPIMLPVWAYKNYSDVDLASRPEGIAAGIIIACIIAVCIMISHFMTQLARRRGGIF